MHDIAAKVATGEISATELIKTTLDQIDMSRLNAFTSLDPHALERAAVIDSTVAAGEWVGPLAGVPIGVKDLIDHEGRMNTHGSSAPVEPATGTAECVRRLEDAAAIVVGRTGLHEYAFGFSSENQWFGPVRNPWDTTLSPGGSSGGSAAAVASRLVAGALGTDTGGSVRVPAALCGIVGLKVTHGRIPISGVYPLAASIDTVGPLATTVGDTALLYSLMAGHHEPDPWSLPVDVQPPIEVALDSLRLGIIRPWADGPHTGDVQRGWDQAIGWLAGADVEIVEIDLPGLEVPGHTSSSYGFEVAAVHRTRFTTVPETYGREVAGRIGPVLDVTSQDYLEALAWRRRLRHQFETALAVCDGLITPTVAANRKVIGEPTISIDGAPQQYQQPLSRYSAPVNHAGLPAIALPLALDGTPPPSLQIIGPGWSESLLLGIGKALETAGLVECRFPPTG